MSYPHQIYTLIIEDELSVRDDYTDFFKSLKDPDVVAPTFVVSFEDACIKLNESFIYHLVIIDLGLPYKTRDTASPGIDPGLALIKLAACREHHPIPAVLVISGRLGLNTTNLPGLQDQLSREFWYGLSVTKGSDQWNEINKAIASIRRYCGVGIHLQDGGSSLYPTLSPREEDMLRRCVLAENAVGVDLKWWRFESGASIKEGDTTTGPTKVLMGRFILDNGQGTSLPTFFKFEPVGNAPSVFLNAGIMDQKLKHIKVIHKAESSQRALLVTQSVSDHDPISLDDFLQDDPESVSAAMARVVNDIKTQLDALGTVQVFPIPAAKVSPSYLDPAQVDKAWKKYAPADLSEVPSPRTIFDRVIKSQKPVWVRQKSGNHGDLNASNIVIEKQESGARAFIFDAGAILPDIGARDLAYLEVTSLLFQEGDDRQSLVRECSEFYNDSVDVPSGIDYAAGSILVRNLKTLITEIRKAAIRDGECELEVYALLVFGAALSQLSGLAIAPAGNKIRNREDAVRLVAAAARWVAKIAPDLEN
jgi:hypothetical protein